MVALTKSKKQRATPTTKRAARRPPAPEPAAISGRDIKRIAGCADVHGRWDLGYIEFSPIGLCATDGRMLAVLNAPGWPYQFYLEGRDVRRLEDDAELNVNGRVFFVNQKTGQTEVTVPHRNPNEVNYPAWSDVLPEAQVLQPVATLNITRLKRLIATLQRAHESAVTLYVRPDDCVSPVLFCNEAGDLGVVMPIGADENEGPLCYFPKAIYQAFKKGTQTIPAAWIPRVPPKLGAAENTAEPASNGGLLGA
jgi:hypothetical protein